MIKIRALAIMRLFLFSFLVVSVAIAVDQPSYVPKQGFVPDEKTAIRIAEAVLVPIYGESQIKEEEPFIGSLKNDTWTVQGHLPSGATNGGVAIVELSKLDARILRVTHGK